ncbi:TetR/AcrR family transcriptional regulator [Herbiconiux daphne]|uniref:TetR/AcrR family transcriptional regulator n=1 Tax=Herbiconiux daphne TaxID=2970914 RepID=A0ABT2H195_9MICO|nr:helix-turn-helix domain-containing protein [Herbiconiux daphne]MCS5733689.1 TetR/AcrR family transcriptional regulator [Herbiconiux daphne]
MPATRLAPDPAVAARDDEHPGLRERKKRETARAIEVAAVELAAEHPLTEITIEAISARADVTSRTFFNYYASKEDAVLGLSKAFGPPLVRPIDYVPGQPVLDTVIASVRDEFASIDFGTPELQAKRRAVVVENPSLLVRDFQTMGDIEESVAVQVMRLLTEECRVPEASRESHAWAIVVLVGSVIRLATRTWSQETRHRRPITDHIDDARDLVIAAARLRT